jgi:DNA-binding SARP family transcriptional activator
MRVSERIVMDQPWRIQMFGGLSAEHGEARIPRFRQRKIGALPAYLAFCRERSHPREVLVEVHWPDEEPEAGRHNLRSALHSRRRMWEPEGTKPGAGIIADRFSVQPDPEAVRTDIADSEQAVDAAKRAADDVNLLEFLVKAVDLYQGELLPGFYQDWVLTEQRRLRAAPHLTETCCLLYVFKVLR